MDVFIYWICMGIYEWIFLNGFDGYYIWIIMDIIMNGYPWTYMAMYGYVWTFVDILWIFMDVYEY